MQGHTMPIHGSDEPLDLTKSNRDYSVFLPSISSMYAKYVSREVITRSSPFPTGLKNGWNDLNFIGELTNLWNYKWCLYSAGHASMDMDAAMVQEKMIHTRDRSKILLVGDSGGYQIATGVLKWPWVAKKGQSHESWEQDKDAIRLNTLRWLENTSDWAMTFDFPPAGIIRYGFDPVTGASMHPGLKTYEDCLKGSVENAHFFMKHRRPGATKFLNVLQGRNLQEGDDWWEICKDWPFEGWAFANVQGHSIALGLRRLIIMRDGKYLDGKDWIHYLGNGKIKAACAFTNIQRALRQHVNPNVTLSYDAASPFVMSAKGQMYLSYIINNTHLGFKSGPIPDSKSLKGSTVLLTDYVKEELRKAGINTNSSPINGSTFGNLFDCGNIVERDAYIESVISRHVTVGDVCVKGWDDVNAKDIDDTVEALQQEMGVIQWENYESRNKKYPSSLDGLSYVLLMNHNVELHIRGCQEACYWMDQPLSIASQHLPPDVLEFKDLCPEIFTSEKPMTLIEKNWRLLANSTGMNADSVQSLFLDDIQGD
jgi:hypothetical protein